MCKRARERSRQQEKTNSMLKPSNRSNSYPVAATTALGSQLRRTAVHGGGKGRANAWPPVRNSYPSGGAAYREIGSQSPAPARHECFPALSCPTRSGPRAPSPTSLVSSDKEQLSYPVKRTTATRSCSPTLRAIIYTYVCRIATHIICIQ